MFDYQPFKMNKPKGHALKQELIIFHNMTINYVCIVSFRINCQRNSKNHITYITNLVFF